MGEDVTGGLEAGLALVLRLMDGESALTEPR